MRRRAGEEARAAVRPRGGAALPRGAAAAGRGGPRAAALACTTSSATAGAWACSSASCRRCTRRTARGAASPLPELPVQYADYAVWQREQLEGEALDRQLGVLAGAAGGRAGAAGAADGPSRARRCRRSAGAQRARRASRRAAGAAAARWGGSEGATLFMVLLARLPGAAVAATAGARTSSWAARSRGGRADEVEELIGFFVNTLVLRDRPRRATRASARLLGRVREATLGAYEHQEVPFEKLVAELQPERSLSHSPLFQVMFALQNAEARAAALARARACAEPARISTSPSSTCPWRSRRRPRGLRGGLNYSTDLFERGTIERMLGAPRAGAGAGRRGRGRAALAAAAARRGGARAGAGGVEPGGGGVSGGPVHPRAVRRRRRRARRTRWPSSTKSESLTYAALNARANQLPTTCGGRAWARRCGWASAWSAAPEMVVAMLARAQGRRRLRAAGPGVSGGAAGLHLLRRRRAGAADAGAVPRDAAGAGRRGAWSAWTARRSEIAAESADEPAERGRGRIRWRTSSTPPAPPAAQGRAGRAPQRGAPVHAPRDAWFGFGAGRRVDAVPLLRLRLLGLGALGRAALRRPRWSSSRSR